jgi:hypothetical protein
VIATVQGQLLAAANMSQVRKSAASVAFGGHYDLSCKRTLEDDEIITLLKMMKLLLKVNQSVAWEHIHL